MIRVSEVVLAGHPDKFCDAIADAVVEACVEQERDAYCQVEVAAWCDEVWINGGVATAVPFALDLTDLVNDVSARIGYRSAGGRGGAQRSARSARLRSDDIPRAFNVHDAVCREVIDPRRWSHHVNDQAICIGWAGYDAKTRFLPPEHFLAHRFREALETSIDGGELRGEGPDGKLLLRIREEADSWKLEHLLVTLQQRETTEFIELVESAERVLGEAYRTLQLDDPRWRGAWNDTELLVNPNGPLISGGPDGDNGQTGRKLVMDYYGPRVPIGGGALCGKHPAHIDRLAARATRDAAIRAVESGAAECLVTATYAPNLREPLDVTWQMEGRGVRQPARFFDHDAMRERYGESGLFTVWSGSFRRIR